MIGQFPYNPMLKVHVVSDLGYMDNMFIALVQRLQSAVTVISSLQGGFASLPEYSAALQQKNYNWGRFWLPHDGFSKHHHTGKSSADILKAQGWTVPDRAEINELSVEDGIKATQTMFPRFYFNVPAANTIVESAKRYRRRINQNTEYVAGPLADEFAHGADTLRYIALNADKFTNENPGDLKRSSPPRPRSWRVM